MPLYPYGQNKGKRGAFGSKAEALIYVLAQESRHTWQHHAPFPTGRVELPRSVQRSGDRTYAVNRHQRGGAASPGACEVSHKTHGTLSRRTAQSTAHFTPWDTISPTVPPSALQYDQQLTCFQHTTRACPELAEGDLAFVLRYLSRVP